MRVWEAIEPLLPPEPPKPKGRRPRKRSVKLHADKAFGLSTVQIGCVSITWKAGGIVRTQE